MIAFVAYAYIYLRTAHFFFRLIMEFIISFTKTYTQCNYYPSEYFAVIHCKYVCSYGILHVKFIMLNFIYLKHSFV